MLGLINDILQLNTVRSVSSRISKGQEYRGFLRKRAGISRLLKEKGREQFWQRGSLMELVS
jgi:hypothetical protein